MVYTHWILNNLTGFTFFSLRRTIRPKCPATQDTGSVPTSTFIKESSCIRTVLWCVRWCGDVISSSCLRPDGDQWALCPHRQPSPIKGYRSASSQQPAKPPYSLSRLWIRNTQSRQTSFTVQRWTVCFQYTVTGHIESKHVDSTSSRC